MKFWTRKTTFCTLTSTVNIASLNSWVRAFLDSFHLPSASFRSSSLFLYSSTFFLSLSTCSAGHRKNPFFSFTSAFAISTEFLCKRGPAPKTPPALIPDSFNMLSEIARLSFCRVLACIIQSIQILRSLSLSAAKTNLEKRFCNR